MNLSAKRMISYLISVITGQRSNLPASLTRFFLLLLEQLFRLLVKIRTFLYQQGLIKSRDLSCQVISVGNIVSGGSGKTPLVKYLAEELRQKGKEVVVVSRGYGAASSKPVVVADRSKLLLEREMVGDEAYMLAGFLPGIPVVTGKDRWQAGQLALERFAPHVLLLDDGFQHWRLKRDLDIVVIDAINPFGYFHLIPRGFLREPLTALKRADVLIISRANQVSTEIIKEIKDKLREYNKKAQLLTSRYRPEYIRELDYNGAQYFNPMIIRGEAVLAFSGLGNPASLRGSLDELGAKIIEYCSFPDHYRYREQDFLDLIERARENQLSWLITTEKDAVKINQVMLQNLLGSGCRLGILGIEVELEGELTALEKLS